jgi:hypothetical protein
MLPKIVNKIKPYLRKDCVEIIEKVGTHVIDEENEAVTPLNNGQECVYVVFDGEIAKCGIEKAYLDGSIRFRKPVSCHLYPIRINNFGGDVLRYSRISECKPAAKFGKEKNVELIDFLKEPLERKYGKKWYEKLKKTVTKNNSGKM